MPNRLLSALALAGVVFSLARHSWGGTFTEDFSSDPTAQGWRVFGQTNLFRWNATNQDLEVTWDSSQPNSYFYHPLGTVLSRSDDFAVAFDLRLSDIDVGVHTNFTAPLEIALGFLNLTEATRTNFLRGTGTDSPDLVEFDYFWDAGYGATVWPACVSSNSAFNYNGSSDYAVLALAADDWYRAVMTYTASNQTLVTTLTNLATHDGTVLTSPLTTNFTDFRVDALAISSYSEAGQDPQYAGSVLAHGIVDNLVVTVPPPPVGDLAGTPSNQVWQVQFTSRVHWLYTLERTADFRVWSPVGPASPGNGAILTLPDPHPPAGTAFYRVQAEKP